METERALSCHYHSPVLFHRNTATTGKQRVSNRLIGESQRLLPTGTKPAGCFSFSKLHHVITYCVLRNTHACEENE